MSRGLQIQNTSKDIFSITFFDNNQQRRNIYFEDSFIGLYEIWRPPYPMKSFIFLKVFILEDLLIFNDLY